MARANSSDDAASRKRLGTYRAVKWPLFTSRLAVERHLSVRNLASVRCVNQIGDNDPLLIGSQPIRLAFVQNMHA